MGFVLYVCGTLYNERVDGSLFRIIGVAPTDTDACKMAETLSQTYPQIFISEIDKELTVVPPDPNISVDAVFQRETATRKHLREYLQHLGVSL